MAIFYYVNDRQIDAPIDTSQRNIDASGITPDDTANIDELDELTDVSTLSPSNQQSLVYDLTAGVWVSSGIPAIESIPLTDLSDVTLSSPASGEQLLYDSSNNTWRNNTPAGGGDMLKSAYDTGDNGIVDKSETLDDGVNSVSATGVSAHLYESGYLHREIDDAATGATDLWSANKINTSLSGKSDTGHSHPLTDLSNVNAPTPSAEESLVYSSELTAWIASGTPAAENIPLNDLSDVNIPSPSAEESLVYSSELSNWVSSGIPAANIALDNLTDVTIPTPAGEEALIYDPEISKWISSGIALSDVQNVFFVGKHGNDVNSGKNIESPFLTIAAAIAAATGVQTGENSVVVKAMDGAIYEENLTIPQYICVFAEQATIKGNQTLLGNTFLSANSIEVNNGKAVSIEAETDAAKLKLNQLHLNEASSGVYIKNGEAFLNIGAAYADSGVVFGGIDGSGHAHIDAVEIEIIGPGTAVLTSGSNASIIVHEIAANNGGTGFDIQGSGNILAKCQEIECTTAYSVKTGKLYLSNNKITGTQTTSNGGTVKFGNRRIKRIFSNSPGTNSNGDYRVDNVGANGSLRITFKVPDDFDSLISLNMIGKPLATLTGQSVDLNSDYAAIGETSTTHSESDLSYTISGTADTWTEWDISSVFSNIEAGDICGIFWDNKSIGTTLYITGVEMKYQT